MDRLEKAPKEVVSPELQKVFFFFWQFPIIFWKNDKFYIFL